jgi:hypothetical protein
MTTSGRNGERKPETWIYAVSFIYSSSDFLRTMSALEDYNGIQVFGVAIAGLGAGVGVSRLLVANSPLNIVWTAIVIMAVGALLAAAGGWQSDGRITTLE